MPKQGTFLDSMRFAWAGVGNAISTQRNMKLHVISSVMVSVVGMSLRFDMASRAALLISVALVWFAEILNTALEAFVDLHMKEYHRLAMIAKDASAAAVLVAAAATVLIFGDLLHENWDQVRGSPEAVWRGVLFGVPLAILVAVMLFWPGGSRKVLLLGAASIGVYVPLARSTANFIFALLALLLVLVVVAVGLRGQRVSPEADGAPR